MAQSSCTGPGFNLPPLPAPQDASGYVPQFLEPQLSLIFNPLEIPVRPSGPPSLNQAAEPRAFFCKIEHRLAKRTRVPFKFRLGSVEYVDRLEGKPGFGW